MKKSLIIALFISIIVTNLLLSIIVTNLLLSIIVTNLLLSMNYLNTYNVYEGVDKTLTKDKKPSTGGTSNNDGSGNVIESTTPQ